MALEYPADAIIQLGQCGSGVLCEMPISLGQAWARPGDEVYLFYRDDGASTFNYSDPCGIAEEGDANVTIDFQDLAPDFPDSTSIYRFTSRAVGPDGSWSQPSAERIVEIDSSGAIVGPVGNPPNHLLATAIKGGKIRVTWQYDSIRPKCIYSRFRPRQKAQI